MLRTRIRHFNFSGLKYFFSLALNNNKQTYMKTVENKYIMIRSSSFFEVFHKDGALLRVQFLFVFDIHSILLSINSTTFIKIVETSRCAFARNKDVPKNVYEVDQEVGGGELSLSLCPGEGNKKIANFRGCARGWGMVTSQIEPCIIL